MSVARFGSLILGTVQKFFTFLSTADVWNGVSVLDFIVATAIISMCLTTLLYKGRT